MHFFLHEPKSTKDTPIFLIQYLKDEKKNFKYPTGQKIPPIDWDFNNRLPKSKRGAAGAQAKYLTSILNQYSSLLESTIKDCVQKNVPITRSYLKNVFDLHFKHKKRDVKILNVVDAVQDFIDTRNKSGGQSASWKQKYSNLKKKLEYFEEHKNKKLSFEDINQDWIDEYCGYLRAIKKEPFKPHNDNTLHRNINFLFTFLYWAEGKHHNIDLKKIKNSVKKYQPDDVHLTSKEVELLEQIKLPRESLERVRDLFLIGVYSGQRFSDYSVFEKADLKGDMIIKKAEKTENESFIPLHPKLKELLDKYDWKLPKISSQKFNLHIQDICKIAEIDDKVKETIYRGSEKEIVYRPKHEMISSHTARRTFITLSAERGMPDHIIMKITGIRDPKTLTKYKKTSQKSVVESMNKYWS